MKEYAINRAGEKSTHVGAAIAGYITANSAEVTAAFKGALSSFAIGDYVTGSVTLLPVLVGMLSSLMLILTPEEQAEVKAVLSQTPIKTTAIS